MTKKLVIRFVKFERALAMQILEQKGKFASGKHTKISACPELVCKDALYLRGCSSLCDFRVCLKSFKDNAERDEYLDAVIKWISEEQFSAGRKLKIGEECLFSDDGEDWNVGEYAGRCAKQLGGLRFLALDGDVSLTRWKYVKPFYCALKIDGDVYTWEMEVGDER